MKVVSYYFPNFHADERNEKEHGKGWSEWRLVEFARPRFPGHDQPKVPVWGYGDEADPKVMAQKIDAARDCGIEAFIFDWYWYEGPYLQRCLDEGFLGAENTESLKFALMWANHNWMDWHPCRPGKAAMIYPWSTTRHTVGFVWDHIIEKYMTKSNYWRVPDGKPYFSIYAVNRFIRQMGGADAAADVLADFQEKAKKAGLPGIHLCAQWSDSLEGEPELFTECSPQEWVTKCGFSSFTSYNGLPLNFTKLGFPVADFDLTLDGYLQMARKGMTTLGAPYYPTITPGFDASPRLIQSEVLENRGFPSGPVLEHTPENFEKALEKTTALFKGVPEDEKILFIEAWNEWTEGSYIEPDEKYGYAFLDLLKKYSSRTDI